MKTAAKITSVAVAVAALAVYGCQQGSSEQEGASSSKAEASAQDHAGHDHAAHAEVEPAAQTTCPVMGGGINKELYVDKDGKRIYVCCQACIDKVKADFAAYEEKLKQMGQKAHML